SSATSPTPSAPPTRARCHPVASLRRAVTDTRSPAHTPDSARPPLTPHGGTPRSAPPHTRRPPVVHAQAGAVSSLMATREHALLGRLCAAARSRHHSLHWAFRPTKGAWGFAGFPQITTA